MAKIQPTQEIVIVIRTPRKKGEHVAYRVRVRKMRVRDTLRYSSYGAAMFCDFIWEACKRERRSFKRSTGHVIRDAEDVREARASSVPDDLLQVRSDMKKADLSDGVFLLH